MATITVQPDEIYVKPLPGGEYEQVQDVTTAGGETSVVLTFRGSQVRDLQWTGRTAAADITRVQLNTPANGQATITCTASSQFRVTARTRGI